MAVRMLPDIKVPLSAFRDFQGTLGREDHLGQMESQYVAPSLTPLPTLSPCVYGSVLTEIVVKSSVSPAVCLCVSALSDVALDKRHYCI